MNIDGSRVIGQMKSKKGGQILGYDSMKTVVVGEFEVNPLTTDSFVLFVHLFMDDMSNLVLAFTQVLRATHPKNVM